MAWLDDNGDDHEFSRFEEELGGDQEDLSEEDEDEELVVTERPGSSMSVPAATTRKSQAKPAKPKAKPKAAKKPKRPSSKKPTAKKKARTAGKSRPGRKKR